MFFTFREQLTCRLCFTSVWTIHSSIFEQLHDVVTCWHAIDSKILTQVATWPQPEPLRSWLSKTNVLVVEWCSRVFKDVFSTLTGLLTKNFTREESFRTNGPQATMKQSDLFWYTGGLSCKRRSTRAIDLRSVFLENAIHETGSSIWTAIMGFMWNPRS